MLVITTMLVFIVYLCLVFIIYKDSMYTNADLLHLYKIN